MDLSGLMGMLGGMMGGGGGGGMGGMMGMMGGGGGGGSGGPGMNGYYKNPQQEAFLAGAGAAPKPTPRQGGGLSSMDQLLAALAMIGTQNGGAAAPATAPKGFWGKLGQGMIDAQRGGWGHGAGMPQQAPSGGQSGSGDQLGMILSLLSMLGGAGGGGGMGGPPVATRPGSPYGGGATGTPWNI